ncbi:MAG: exopolysaccharide biosynthesis protein [Lacunisphaera sp.]
MVNQLHAIVILISAAILLLPLPIPLSNLLPAWAIFLIASGLLERDGLFIVLGYFAFLVGALYFLLLGSVANEAFHHAWQWLRSQW